MEKTVFNIKVSEQYFDHSNKDYGGNTNINWCRMLLHYPLMYSRMKEWRNEKFRWNAPNLPNIQWVYNNFLNGIWKHGSVRKGEPHERCQETSRSCVYSKFKRKERKPISMEIAFYFELRHYFHDSEEHLYFIINTAKKNKLLKVGTILKLLFLLLKLNHFYVNVLNSKN